jgi:putative transcriptional regulator
MPGNNSNAGAGESGLYNRIAVLRAERGVSRQDLADALGVNYQTVGFLERGDYGPSLRLAFSIAQFFGLPIEAIFSTEPFRLLSEQVYGKAGNRGTGVGNRDSKPRGEISNSRLAGDGLPSDREVQQ